MRTFKQNIVVLEDSDRIEIRFVSPDLDHSKCSIYINPLEGEIVINLGGIEVVASAIPAPETWGAFYFPRGNAIISPSHPDMEDGSFGVYLCDEAGMTELGGTIHRGIRFLSSRS